MPTPRCLLGVTRSKAAFSELATPRHQLQGAHSEAVQPKATTLRSLRPEPYVQTNFHKHCGIRPGHQVCAKELQSSPRVHKSHGSVSTRVHQSLRGSLRGSPQSPLAPRLSTRLATISLQGSLAQKLSTGLAHSEALHEDRSLQKSLQGSPSPKLSPTIPGPRAIFRAFLLQGSL